jgi:hypothetical protein
MNSLTSMTVAGLLATHSAAMNELRARGVLRTQNNPTGDYTEWLVSRHLGLSLEGNSSKGFDAVDSNGLRYQIKGRRVTHANPSTQLGVIRDIVGANFDFLIAVVFDEDWTVHRAVKIPHGVVGGISRFREHVNGHVMHLRSSILSHEFVEDITLPLRATAQL